MKKAALFIVCSLAVLLLMDWVVRNDPVITQPTTDRIFITAAHIPESEYPELQLVYSDVEADVAIYVNPAYMPKYIPDGTPVVCRTLEGVVEKSEGQTFVVQLANPEYVVKGMSGSPVYADGEIIGFISALISGGRLRCVYY